MLNGASHVVSGITIIVDRADDSSITILRDLVQLGTGDAIFSTSANDVSITNTGTIASATGGAIIGGASNEAVDNAGNITGAGPLLRCWKTQAPLRATYLLAPQAPL
ncbi:hypothetical protein ASD8599_01580 [Ascidiaceihabitans donghaensis]|uniref:Uncharacterized protein n=1 Tax=Ascidiaceihabitans donghaensis TaxID=1510460 RepID=A0A2R8BCQ3_9RHOB|nr:hypothetical protein ASD8599_01580 [Ascidiaceihabitans donghaensis]